MELTESDRGAHDPMAKRGDAPAARAGDLRNQPVDVEAVQSSFLMRSPKYWYGRPSRAAICRAWSLPGCTSAVTTAGSDELANQQLGPDCLPAIAVIVFLFT